MLMLVVLVCCYLDRYVHDDDDDDDDDVYMMAVLYARTLADTIGLALTHTHTHTGKTDIVITPLLQSYARSLSLLSLSISLFFLLL